MMSNPNIQQVHIELQRVQTWLFAVPRLRAMVGANALLGETLRVALPKLARETGRWVLAPSTDSYPMANAGDPLKAHDDPDADAKDGILSRDGGHFEGWFASGAEAFAEAAAELLRRALPELRFRVSIDGKPRDKSHVQLSTELPVLAPCEWTGRGLASAIVTRGNPNDRDYEERAVSLDVLARETAGERAAKGNVCDLASLLSATTKLHDLDHAQELRELVGNGYLALIHADGNGVGKSKPGDVVGDARFFHQNRVLIRQAAKAAIDHACDLDAPRRNDEQAKAETSGKLPKVFAPLIPLMLGGDDLLLVCRAEVALPFVVMLCKELETLQTDSNGFRLTLGAGVVIAKHTIPIHRLHEVAEHLASSAKRRYRGLKEASAEGRSVVDWAVYSTAWIDEPEDIRRRDWVRGHDGNLRVLSQRPLDVLGEGLRSLQGLVSGAAMLRNAPRSQLRYLVDQLPRGRALSELAFAELPKEARAPLTEAGVSELWWRSSNNGPWLTALLDLVEVSEIARLGRSVQDAHAEKEAAHA
jgi:hypothetical protein